MSAQSTIAKLRAEVEAAQRRGESDQDIINTLVRVVPADVLKELYRDSVRKNRSDISAAIEGALFNPSDFHATLPPQAQDTTKASSPGDLGPAIIEAFGRRSTPTRKTVTTIPSADGPRHGQLRKKS